MIALSLEEYVIWDSFHFLTVQEPQDRSFGFHDWHLSFFFTDNPQFRNMPLNCALEGIVWPLDATCGKDNVLALPLVFFFFAGVAAFLFPASGHGLSFRGVCFCLDESSRLLHSFLFPQLSPLPPSYMYSNRRPFYINYLIASFSWKQSFMLWAVTFMKAIIFGSICPSWFFDRVGIPYSPFFEIRVGSFRPNSHLRHAQMGESIESRPGAKFSFFLMMAINYFLCPVRSGVPSSWAYFSSPIQELIFIIDVERYI